ncbi:MAG: hypothetical protein HY873_03710 [Chloroflexi bacterium]|nr:hypothetical protein [Chloroflexota bacterium]
MSGFLVRVRDLLLEHPEPDLAIGETVRLRVLGARLFRFLSNTTGVVTLTDQHLFYRPIALRITAWFYRGHAATIAPADVEHIELLEWYHRFRGNWLMDVWRVRLTNGTKLDFQGRCFRDVAEGLTPTAGSWFDEPRAAL